MNLSYEVLVQPILFALVIGYVLVQLLRGFHRVTDVVGDIEVKRLRYSGQRLRRTLLVGIAGAALIASVVVVPFGHRAVIWSAIGGVSENERAPGLSFVVPVLQTPKLVDVRVQSLSTVDAEGKANAFVQTEELLLITIRATLQYRIIPTQADVFVSNLGPDYREQIVKKELYDAVREVAGSADATAFADGIVELGQKMEDNLRAVLKKVSIEVVSLTVEDAVFESEYTAAVRAEEIAERKSDEAENLVRAREAEREQRVIAADAARQEQLLAGQGERDRIAAIVEALNFTPQEYLRWLQLTRWNGVLPAVVTGDSDLLLNIDPTVSEPEPTETTTTTTTVPEE